MNCHDMGDRLHEYIDGDLPDAERQEVENRFAAVGGKHWDDRQDQNSRLQKLKDLWDRAAE